MFQVSRKFVYGLESGEVELMVQASDYSKDLTLSTILYLKLLNNAKSSALPTLREVYKQ